LDLSSPIGAILAGVTDRVILAGGGTLAPGAVASVAAAGAAASAASAIEKRRTSLNRIHSNEARRDMMRMELRSSQGRQPVPWTSQTF